MTDNPQGPQNPQSPQQNPNRPADMNAGYEQAIRIARPKRISYTPKVKLNLPKWSPYNRPPTGDLPVGQWVGQTYWQDPQRIARAAVIIDAIPPGYNQPEWLDDDLSNKIRASNEYLKQSYGDEWWLWGHNLPDDDPLKAEAAAWRVPAELQAAEEQTAPTGRQLMALYGIRDDDLARAGYKEDDLVNAWMQGQAQTSYQPGEVTAPYTVDEEWIKTIRATQDDIKFMYPYTSSDTGYLGLVNPDRVKQWTTRFFVMNGVTPDIAAKLPVWQMPFYALFNTIGGQVAQQAVNMGLAGGSIGAAAGSIFGPAGTLIGGVGGALLAGGGAGIVTLMQTEEERRKAEAAAAGEVYDESEFIKFTEQVYSALDVLFQAGEVGFGTMLQYAYENPLMTGGMEGWKELAENPAAVREAARLTYESAPAVVESLINSLSGKGAYYTRAELGNPETAKVEGRAGIEVATLMMRDIRKQLEAGYSPDELNSMWVERIKSGIMFENNPEYTAGQAALGFWGEFSDLAAGYWLDPLDQLGNFSNAIGGGAAKLKGKPLLAFAYQNTEGPIDAIRMYGALLRTGALPGSPKAAEIGAMGRLERMLANVDENGNPNPGATSALGRFFGMTRESLAYETLTSSVNALQLALEDANTPDDLIRVVNGIARFSPEAAAELSKSMPWIDSPDGSSFAMSLRDYKKTLSGVMAMWMAGEINRSAWKQFTHAAGYDDVTFIANVKNKGAETVFNGIVARAKQNASQNVGFLRDVQNGTLTAKYLDNMVSQHAKGGLDINFDELKGRVFVSMMDSVEKWAVKYYGIKPDAEWVRISNAIKDVQSFMLLGFNASYAINNILSNRITMAWQGVFGLRSANSIDDFWTRAIGFEPIRLDAGIGGAAGAGTDAGGTRKGYRIGTQIRAEKRKPGALTAFADFMRSDAAGKIQFATRMAQAEEASASRQAFTAGAIKAKSKFWKAGVGFAKMPPALEAVLRSLDKRAPRLLYSMIEGVPNPKALYESLFSDVMRRSLDASIPGSVDELRANGMDIDDSGVRSILEENGIYDFVSSELLKAENDQDIDRVWDAANETIQKRLDELAIKQRSDEAAIGSAKAVVEGVAGALEYLDSVWENINTFWNRHFDDWEIVHSEAGALDDVGRDALYDAQFRASNREWNRMQSIRDAQIMGTLRGLGATDETMNDISIYLEETHSSWTQFYNDSNNLRRDFFSRKDWKDKAERQAAWEALRQELKRRYQETLDLEERNQIRIDGDFARLFAEQTQTDPAIAQAWRDGARETRKKMAKMLQDFRESLEGMDRNARSAAWKKFLDDEYRPAIQKLTRDNMVKAMGLYENTGTAKRAPAYDRATVRELRLALLRNDIADADQWNNALADLNSVLTDKEEPFTRMEYNVTPSRERMTLLEDAFKRLNDQKKAAEPEPEPPAQPGRGLKREGVPAFMSNKVKSALAEDGYTAQQIKDMTPNEAIELIASKDEQTGRDRLGLGYEDGQPAEPVAEPAAQPAEAVEEVPAYGGPERRSTLNQAIRVVDTGRTDAGEAGRGTETPRPEPVVPDQFSRIAEVANRFGVPSAKVDGQPVTGFKIHIANIMAKYMPEKYAQGVAFESVDPADLEVAMSRRASNPLSEASEALQDAMIAVERARRNEYYSARAGKLGEFSDAGAVRQMAIEDLVYAYEQAGRDNKEARAEINESIALADARAAVWAKENSKTPEEWWLENIAGVMTSEQFISMFGRRLDPGALITAKKGEAATFQVGGRSIVAILTDPNASTLPHELAHIIRREMGIGRTAEFISYFEERYGYKLGYDEETGQFIGDEPVTSPDGNVMPLREYAEEVFARLFEIYLREGRAPTRGLARVFDAFKTWLKSIYTSLTTGELAGYDLNDNMRALYDSLFAVDKEIAIDEAVAEQPAAQPAAQPTPEPSTAIYETALPSEVEQAQPVKEAKAEPEPGVIYERTYTPEQAADYARMLVRLSDKEIETALSEEPEANRPGLRAAIEAEKAGTLEDRIDAKLSEIGLTREQIDALPIGEERNKAADVIDAAASEHIKAAEDARLIEANKAKIERGSAGVEEAKGHIGEFYMLLGGYRGKLIGVITRVGEVDTPGGKTERYLYHDGFVFAASDGTSRIYEEFPVSHLTPRYDPIPRKLETPKNAKKFPDRVDPTAFRDHFIDYRGRDRSSDYGYIDAYETMTPKALTEATTTSEPATAEPAVIAARLDAGEEVPLEDAIKVTPEIEEAGQPTRKYSVDTEQIGSGLFFKTENGDLYRAAVDSPADDKGLPNGARWEAPAHQADQRLSVLRATAEETSRVEPATEPTPVPAPAQPEAPAAAQFTTPASVMDYQKRIRNGELSAEEIRQAFDAFVSERAQIEAQINRMAIDQIKKTFRIYRPGNKAEAVKSAMGYLEDGFIASGGYTWNPFGEQRVEAVRRAVLAQTDETIKEAARKHTEAKESLIKALTNPEKIDEFQTFIARRGIEALSAEQKIKYDELIATRNMQGRAPKPAEPATVAPVKIEAKASIKETTKKRDGTPIFVVQLSDRVPREVFTDMSSKARKLGGYYSNFVRADAGFTFATRDAAERFMALLESEEARQARAEEAATAPTITTETTESPAAVEEPSGTGEALAAALRPVKTVNKLRALADRLEESGNERLNADRNTNTRKRAQEAAYAEENARADIAMARTVRNIADALDSGEAHFLQGISAKTQIETLDMLLRNAQGVRQRKENVPYSESLRYAPATMADIEYAEYPYPRFNSYALKDIKEAIGNKAGFKQIVKRLEALVSRSSGGTTDWFKVTDPRDIEALISAVKEVNSSYVKGNTMIVDYSRVQAAGLLTIEELRAGLREYLAYKTQREKPSRVKELERSLIGRKIPGYFPTPRGLAQRVVSTADIQPGMSVLEPSAGKGSIAEVVNEMHRDANLSVIEYDATLKNILVEKGFNVVGYDIFGHTGQYDRIVMNPPFENMADIDHVMKAYNDLLKPGGRLVSIMGAGPFFRNDAKAVEFRNFLDRIGADYEQLPEGSFLESDRSTGVNTYIVTLDKAPELPSKEELVSIEDTVRAAVETAMTEAPAAVEEAPAYAAPIETTQRAPGEKVNSWGFTKKQELYIAGEIEALYNALYTEEYKKHYPGLDEKVAVTRTVNELRDAKDQPNLVLNVPDGPNMRLTTVNAMNNVYYAMTGRTLTGFKKATEARNPSTAKMPPVPDMDVWGVLRMYGNPINALEAIKRQGGYQSDASRALISDLQGMVDGTWSLYSEGTNGLGYRSKTIVISSEGISQSDYQRQIMDYANSRPLTLIDRLVPVGGFRIEEVNNLAGEIGVTIDQTAAEAAPTGPFETVIGSRDIPTLDLSSESSIKKHLAPLLVDAARILKEERAKRADEEFKAVHGRAGELFKGGTGQIFGRSAKMSVDSDRNEMVIYSSTKTDGFRFTVRLTDEGWEVFGRRFGSYDATDIGNLLGLRHKETSVKIVLGGTNYTFINERQAAAIYKAITGKKLPGYEETIYPTATMSSVLFKRKGNTDNLWSAEGIEQEYKSAKTSINSSKLPATFNRIDVKQGDVIADIGGGRFDNAERWAAERGAALYVYDPFNRTREQNARAIAAIRDGQADIVTVNNTLNVIREPENRRRVIEQAENALKPGGVAYFLIYEGNQSGIGAASQQGASWQNNARASAYIDEIKSVFGSAVIKNGLIQAKKSTSDVLFKRGSTATTKKLREGQKHGEYNVVAGVYYQGDDGIKKLAAWLPERWDIGAWRKDDQGEYRVLGLDLDDPNKMVVEDRKGGIRSVEIKPKQEATPAINAPIGAVDANRSAPPMYDGMQEHYERDIRPVMEALRRSSKERDTNIKPGMLKRLNDGSKEMNEAKAMLKAYAAQVKAQSGGARLAIAKMGELQRDMALLNYSKRYGFDNFLTAIFPYQFWYTRSVANWAARFIQKPTILANYARLRAMQERHTRDGFPSRLDGKIGIPLPFMPEGAGGGIFVDPMRIMYPFENFATPLARLAQQDNRNTKAAKGIIYQWIEDGTETESAALEAINTKKGAIWERAMRAVKSGEDQDIANPFDFMNAMSGFSLPLNYAYQYTIGNPKRIGQTPIMRMVQSGLGLAGANPKIADYINKPRVAMGLPAVDQWQDYRVDRELANMTADGLITSDQARTAMVDRSGEIFDAARRRLGKQQGIKYLFASFLADLYPEGEQTQRALQNDYYRAIDALDNGDNNALKKFYDAHPEYEARVAQMQEPEERLRGMLVAEVWDRYTQQNAAEKRAYADQFGDVFEHAFLNKETRDYTAISAETLAWWARSMGGNLPMKAPDTPGVVTPDMPESVQQYYDDLNSQFPNAGRIWNMYYSMDKSGQDMMRKAYPQLDAYTAWKNKYFAQHPEVIQYVTNDNAELAGLPLDIQSRVYSFRATRDERYPGIFEIQDGYFAIPEEQRAAYKKAYPELEEYWDWRRSYAAAYPKASPWIMSEESLSNAIIGQYGNAEQLTNEQLAEFSPSLMRALLAAKYAGDELRSGMEDELYQHWEDFGKPGDSFDAWVQDYVYKSLE